MSKVDYQNKVLPGYFGMFVMKVWADSQMYSYNQSSSSQHGLCVPGGGVYVHFRVGDVTNPRGMSCSP